MRLMPYLHPIAAIVLVLVNLGLIALHLVLFMTTGAWWNLVAAVALTLSLAYAILR